LSTNYLNNLFMRRVLLNLSVPFLKRTAFIFLLTIASTISWAQVVGDYRSNVVATGNWTVLATWERWNGTAWVTPTAAQGYPGQNTGTQTVTIRNGHTISLNVSPARSIGALVVGTAVTNAAILVFSDNSNQSLSVSGNITIGSNGLFYENQVGNRINSLTIGGNLSVASGGNFDMFENMDRTNVTFNGTNISIGGSIIEFNDVSFLNNGTATLTSDLTSIVGNVTIGASSSLNAGSFTHTVSGNWTNNGIFNAGTSTIIFNGVSAQSIGASNFYEIAFNNAGPKTATGALAIAGNVIIGSNFSAGSFTHTVGGSWINNGTFTAGTSTIAFNGSTAQTIGGSVASTFNNLTINKSSGITLNQAETVAGALTLTNGIVNTTATNLLNLTDGATVTGASHTSFVNGPVQKVGDDNFVFPVGETGSGYHPIAISGLDEVSSFTADYFRPNPFSTADKVVGLNGVSECEYWNLSRSSGTIPVNIALYYNEQSRCGNLTTYPYNDVVARFNGTSWYTFGVSGVVGDEQNGNVLWNGISDFSNTIFSLGISPFTAPLPVNFISFKAHKVTNGTQLTWNVAQQVNVRGYEVERSSNGIQFSKIGFVAASENQESYTFTDAEPAVGAVFYRIKNVDNDGAYKYSTVLAVRNGTASIVLKAFPIPAKDKVTLQHQEAATGALISLSAPDGRRVRSIRPTAGSMQTEITLSGLPSGMYVVSFDTGNGQVETVKLIKR
jgi:hypothetical protein